MHKWVQCTATDDLNDAIVRSFIESGRIYEFMGARERGTASETAQTFEEYTSHWFTLHKSHLNDTTKKGYSYILNHYLLPEFGSVALADISTDGIQQLFNKWSGLAKSTISKMELMLKQNLESAVKDKLIKDSPVDKGR